MDTAVRCDLLKLIGGERGRHLLTVAGNPAVSTPNSDRLSEALERLDFMVSIDIYVNETTRHAISNSMLGLIEAALARFRIGFDTFERQSVVEAEILGHRFDEGSAADIDRARRHAAQDTGGL